MINCYIRRTELRYNFFCLFMDAPDIHRFPTVHMAVAKSVNIRAILRYRGKIPTYLDYP